MSLAYYNDEIEFLSKRRYELNKLNHYCKKYLSAEEIKDIEQSSRKIEVSIDKIRYLRFLIASRSNKMRQETYWSIAAILSIIVAIPIWSIYTPNPNSTLSNVILLFAVALLIMVSSISFQRFIYNQTAKDSLSRILEFEVIELGALAEWSIDWKITIKGFSIYPLSDREIFLQKLFHEEKWFIVSTLECIALCFALKARDNDLDLEEVSNKLSELAPSTDHGMVEIPLEIELPKGLKYTYAWHYS